MEWTQDAAKYGAAIRGIGAKRVEKTALREMGQATDGMGYDWLHPGRNLKNTP